jgi:hypothetical protein
MPRRQWIILLISALFCAEAEDRLQIARSDNALFTLFGELSN